MTRLAEQEREAERPDVIALLRRLAEYWRGHDQEAWLLEVRGLWKALHRSIGAEWCEMLVERGRETDLEMGWPETGCKVGEPYWELDQWCSLMIGLFRNRPNLVEEPLEAVFDALRFFTPSTIAPLDLNLAIEPDDGWNKWCEANAIACEVIADMLAGQKDDTTVATAEDDPPGDNTERLSLTQNQKLVRDAMAAHEGAELLSVRACKGLIPTGKRLGNVTVRKCVKELIEKGLAERPQGPRKGARLTPKGRRTK